MRYIACKEVDNDEIVKGNACITSMQELYRSILYKDTTEIVIRKDFSDKFFTPSGLKDFIINTNKIKPNIQIIVQQELSIFNDSIVRDLKSVNKADELVNMILMNPTKMISLIHTLCDEHLSASTETLEANSKVSTMHLQNTTLRLENNRLQDRVNKLQNLQNETSTKLHSLASRIVYKYNKDINTDTMLQLNTHRYDKILYVKEITRVHFTDTLIRYIQEILKSMYNVPARLVVIESYYSYGKAYMYPDCVPHYELTYNDVRESDIFMAGFQPKLMQDILNNSMGNNFLIILDRCGYGGLHIEAPKVELICTASDPKDAEIYGIPNDRLISYSMDTLNIPYIPNFDKLSHEEKMIKYSSMEIMKGIIDLMERR